MGNASDIYFSIERSYLSVYFFIIRLNLFNQFRSQLGILMFFISIKTLVFGSILYFLELEGASEFESIIDACWWAIVSLTTTGYGDMAPVTSMGKVLGTLTVVSSTIVMVLPVPSIVAHFTNLREKEKRRREIISPT